MTRGGGSSVKGSILCVDDDPTIDFSTLIPEGIGLIRCYCVNEALKQAAREIEEGRLQAAIVDIELPMDDDDLPMPRTGIDLTRRLRSLCATLPVFAISGFGFGSDTREQPSVAHELFGASVQACWSKPLDPDRVRGALERALQRTQQPTTSAPRTRKTQYWFSGPDGGRFCIVGSSAAIQDNVVLKLEKIAPTGLNVLISGESGTGKDLVARAIHVKSGVRGRLVAINCAAIPEQLLESELFGHTRGAYTGAVVERKGLMVQGHRGTLFLDEVSELPLTSQAKLLRALQDGEVTPLGSDNSVRVGLRVIAATNQDLEALVTSGRFREDLYYRLNVVRIHIAPLRDRPEDIAPLANYVLDTISRETRRTLELHPLALRWLTRQPWPGNVREMENTIQRTAAECADGTLLIEDFTQEWPRETTRPSSIFKVLHQLGDLMLEVPQLTLHSLPFLLAEDLANRPSLARRTQARILGIGRNTLSRYSTPFDAVARALDNKGLDLESAAKSLPGYTEAFLATHLCAFLSTHDDEELLSYAREQGLGQDWIRFMRSRRSA